MTRKLKIIKPDSTPRNEGDLVIDRDAFLDALESVKQVVKTKSVLPILNNVLVDFSPSLVTITATDLELTIVVTISGMYDISEGMRRLLPGGVLREALGKMREGDLVVSFSPDNIVTITQDAYSVSFPEILCDDFPEISVNAAEHVLTIEGKQLARAINKVMYAVSKDPTRYALTGVGLTVSDETLFTVGTDGFRISVYKTPAEASPDLPVIILPSRSAQHVSDLVDTDAIIQVRISRGENGRMSTICFDAPNILISSRIIDQVYPDWTTILSFEDPHPDRLCSVATSYMVEALERIGVVVSQKYKEPIKMTVSDGRIAFTSQSGCANAQTWLPGLCKMEAETNVVVGQMADAFGHVGTDRTDIEIPETYGMIKLTEKPEKDGPPRHIQGIMPWRT